jgi:hypothetical protein
VSRTDFLSVIVLGVVSATVVWHTVGRFDPRFFQEPIGNDVWFEADLPIVADRLQHRWSDQARNSRHPLFPLLATVPVHVLKGAGLGEAAALRTFVASTGGLWTVTLCVLLYGLTRRRLDAMVFAALAHASAAAMFWLPVPDTYALGSISVMVPLALCAWDPAGRRGAGAYTAAAAASLTVTTSNWLTGVAAGGSRQPWRQALQIAANSLTAVVLIWGLQRLIFPTAPFFIGEGVQTRFILPEGAAGISVALRAMLSHVMVMPAVAIAAEAKWGAIMSVQHSALASAGAVGAIATVMWAGLLVAGAWALAATGGPMRLPLALALAGHLLVYSVYGEETFLYALHMLPLLVAVAACAAQTRLRPIVLGVAASLTIVLVVHNGSALTQALKFFETGAR